MKSDISRNTFDARKHYSKVVMQQGRVQLDADWNEQQDILMHHVETRATNIIGASGASIGAGGFAVEVTPDGNDLIISPGSLYVDGVLCELEQGLAVPTLSASASKITLSFLDVDVENLPFAAKQWAELLDANGQRVGLFRVTDVSFDQDKQVVTLSIDQATFKASSKATYQVRPLTTYMTQPYYPAPQPDLTGLLGPGASPDQVYLVYLDVWQRYVTALDDPYIQEVALGSADTAGRVQAIWQVKVQPVQIPGGDLLRAIQDESKESERGKQPEHIHRLSKLLRVMTFASPLLNGEWAANLPTSTGKLNARIAPFTDGGAQGYTGLENQLYHVEIHVGTDEDQKVEAGAEEDQEPSFKWARDNASLLLAASVDKVGLLTIQGSGQGNLLGLAVNQYVELFTPDMPLLGEPGLLPRIQQIDDITGQITLDPPPTAFIPQGEATQQQVMLRLWNGYSKFAIAQDAGARTTDWFDLENNIQVQFAQNSTYLSGDYWLIPARTSTRQLEWPHTPQPRVNAPHYYARLSCLLPTRLQPLAQDCRPHISPLGASALHIIDINWKNDALEERVPDERTGKTRGKLQTGLRFTLDGEPDATSVGAMQSAITVSLETALPGGGAGVFLVNGIVEIKGNIIEWHWDREEKSGWFAHHIAKFDKWLDDWFDDQERYIRVRITLKGRFIWQTLNDGRRLYLDGQTFGFPASDFSDQATKSGYKRPDGKQPEEPHIDLRLPSGTGRPASDFESWFYIRE